MFTDALTYLWNRRTTVFGYIQTALGFMVATQGMFSEGVLRWLVFSNGLLTVLIGHYNNSQLKQSYGTMALQKDPGVPPAQGGFIRPLLLAVLLAISTVALVLPIGGCTNTMRAIRNADTPADYALVFLAGYESALKTANQYRREGKLTPEDLSRVRKLELTAYPFVAPIPKLQAAYEATKSAEDAAALQKAVDEAILAAADFIRAVQDLTKRIEK